MTNEEKASDIVLRIQNRDSLDYDARRANYMYDAALEMASWKEQQMIEIGVSFIKEVCRLNNFDNKILITIFKKAMEE